MNFPAGSIVRTPTYTLLMKENASLRTLRDGDRTWKLNQLPSWTNLDVFLEEKKPEWWQVVIAYPKDWFKSAFTPGGVDVPAYAELHHKFRDEILNPLVMFYCLVKASDESSYVHKYGTHGSPYSKTAEQQFREIEPDPRKWMEMVYDCGVPAKAREKFLSLWYRYKRSQNTLTPLAPIAAHPVPVAPPAPTAADIRREHLERAIKTKKLRFFLSAVVDPEIKRKIRVSDSNGEICGEAYSLSPDTVFATIYHEEGGFSGCYMPLNDFLELYTQL